MSTKKKVLVSYDCPHCEKELVVETNNYHSILHGEYFLPSEVQSFEEIKTKVKDGDMPYSILIDSYSWMRENTCDHCKKNINVIMTEGSFRGDPKKETWRFKVVKAGNRIPRKSIEKLFTMLNSKDRGTSKNSNDNYVPCEKERFVTKLWHRIAKDIAKVPWVIKTEGFKDVVYIGRVEYTLGHGEEIKLTMFSIVGKMYQINLSQFDLNNLEYLPFDSEVAKTVMNSISEM
jgi:hypothetical protein